MWTVRGRKNRIALQVYLHILYHRKTNTHGEKHTFHTDPNASCSGVRCSNCVCNCSAYTHHRGTEKVSLCFKSQLSASSTKSIFNAPVFFHGSYQKLVCMLAEQELFMCDVKQYVRCLGSILTDKRVMDRCHIAELGLWHSILPLPCHLRCVFSTSIFSQIATLCCLVLLKQNKCYRDKAIRSSVQAPLTSSNAAALMLCSLCFTAVEPSGHTPQLYFYLKPGISHLPPQSSWTQAMKYLKATLSDRATAVR